MGGEHNKKEVKNKDLWLELTDLIKNKKLIGFGLKDTQYRG